MLDLRVALPIALWLAVTACGPGPNELIDQWRGAQRIVTFEGESKHAITPDFPSSLGFEATLPSEPFLEFAIAVDAPRDLSRGQVRFTVRLRADTKTFVVFDEVVRARRGPRWHDRRINLEAWRDRDVELVLEARPADPSAVGAWADRVRIAWGDPVVSNHGLDTVARPSVVFVLVDTLRRDHLGFTASRAGSHQISIGSPKNRFCSTTPFPKRHGPNLRSQRSSRPSIRMSTGSTITAVCSASATTSS